ncbi:hypothetical protein EJ110_NYTH39680 [Nymphaea thermarum]|nr:hypothetical protein EJ110_NYTH39680 [Nymphaea thermarum]
MVWIVGTLSQDIANEVLHKESVKDMWDSLAATYSQARNETRIMQLHHDIHQMRQDGRPLHTYYSSLKSMFERLNSYFPVCKCEQQKAYRDMLMVGVFLSGLDSVYESAKNQMLTSPSVPPIDEAYSRLSRIPIPAATVPETTSAMLATRGRGGSSFARGRGGRGRGTPTSRPVCQFCHRIGHTVDKCWQKHGRPAFANQTASTESPEQPKAQHTAPSSELRVDDLLSQLRSLIGDRSQHTPTTSIVTTAASASSSGMYSAYTVSPATDTTDWLIDSVASTHLSLAQGYRKLFIDWTWVIRGTHRIEIGSFNIRNHISLNHICLFPGVHLAKQVITGCGLIINGERGMRSPERRWTLRQSSSYAPLLLYVLYQVTDQPPHAYIPSSPGSKTTTPVNNTRTTTQDRRRKRGDTGGNSSGGSGSGSGCCNGGCRGGGSRGLTPSRVRSWLHLCLGMSTQVWRLPRSATSFLKMTGTAETDRGFDDQRQINSEAHRIEGPQTEECHGVANHAGFRFRFPFWDLFSHSLPAQLQKQETLGSNMSGPGSNSRHAEDIPLNPLLPKITMVGISTSEPGRLNRSSIKKTMDDLTRELEQASQKLHPLSEENDPLFVANAPEDGHFNIGVPLRRGLDKAASIHYPEHEDED